MSRFYSLLFVLILATVIAGCNPGTSTSATIQLSPTTIPALPTATSTNEPTLLPVPTATSTASSQPKTAFTSTATVTLGKVNATATQQAANATATSYAGSTPPAGKYRPDPALIAGWKDYPGGLPGVVAHNFLGWALQPAKQTKMAIQEFGRYGGSFCSANDSMMIWREDTRFIYFMIDGNYGLHAESCRDWWRSYLDTWQPGDPNNEDLTAPEGKIVPKMGIGKVWRENFYGKNPEGLGFATGPEQYFNGTIQPFENGLVFRRDDNGRVYVLFNRFEYWTRGGLSWDKVWFRIDGTSR